MKTGVSLSVKETGKGAKSRRYSLESDMGGEATLEELLIFTKGALIQISTDALKEEQQKGFDKNPTLVVDGKFNKTVSQVKPLGKIQYVARQPLKQIIIETFEAIRIRTKIVTGEYGLNNVVTFNGQQVANNRESLNKWLESVESFQPKDKIRFINTAPYARRLESLGVSNQVAGQKRPRARHKKKDSKKTAFNNRVAVPNGTYALAYKAIARKYKKNSFIAFRLVPGSEISFMGGGGKNYRRTFARGKSKGKPYLYPSIIISAVTAGITDGAT